VTTDQATKAARFRALHERPEPLLLPNPWDAGTARLLASLGFEALATTSLGVANTAGRARATRQEILDNCRAINEATSLPVNADLENGFADEPADAARMIEEGAAADLRAARGVRRSVTVEVSPRHAAQPAARQGRLSGNPALGPYWFSSGRRSSQ
jgi:2-methylisocitrate lyase-like PEP mutase family enzyme